MTLINNKLDSFGGLFILVLDFLAFNFLDYVIAIRNVGLIIFGYQTICIPYEIKWIHWHLLHVKCTALSVDQLLILLFHRRFRALLH